MKDAKASKDFTPIYLFGNGILVNVTDAEPPIYLRSFQDHFHINLETK